MADIVKEYKYKTFFDTFNINPENIPWYFIDSTSNVDYLKFLHKDTLKLISENPQLVHNLIHNENLDGDSFLKNQSVKYVFDFCEKNQIPIKKILRIKLNLLLKNNTKTNFFHTPHVDNNQQPHNVLLFYQNDSDGDTVVFKEKFNLYKNQKLSISKRIKPKKIGFNFTWKMLKSVTLKT